MYVSTGNLKNRPWDAEGPGSYETENLASLSPIMDASGQRRVLFTPSSSGPCPGICVQNTMVLTVWWMNVVGTF